MKKAGKPQRKLDSIWQEQTRYLKSQVRKYKRKNDLQGMLLFLAITSMQISQLIERLEKDFGEETVETVLKEGLDEEKSVEGVE